MATFEDTQAIRASALNTTALRLCNDISTRLIRAEAPSVTDIAEMMFWTGYGIAAAASIFYDEPEREVEYAKAECQKLLDAIGTIHNVRTVA